MDEQLCVTIISESFSVNKEEADNEPEKASEKETTERVNEDTEMVWSVFDFKSSREYVSKCCLKK